MYISVDGTGKPGGTNKDPHNPNSSGYKRNASTFLDMVITTSFAARARLEAAVLRLHQ